MINITPCPHSGSSCLSQFLRTWSCASFSSKTSAQSSPKHWGFTALRLQRLALCRAWHNEWDPSALQEQKCYIINKQVNKEVHSSAVLKYVDWGTNSENTSVSLISTRWFFSVPEVTVIYFISNLVQVLLRSGHIPEMRIMVWHLETLLGT